MAVYQNNNRNHKGELASSETEMAQVADITEKLNKLQVNGTWGTENSRRQLDVLSVDAKTILKSIQQIMQVNPMTKELEGDVIEEAIQQSRKNSLYAAKMKFWTRYYSNLNEKLTTDISTLKILFSKAKENIESFNVPKEEIYKLDQKIKRYDEEICKLEKKYPWLKTNDLKLPNIQVEITKLENLRELHQQLTTELDFYKNLSPDLTEARHQKAAAKANFERMRELNKL